MEIDQQFHYHSISPEEASEKLNSNIEKGLSLDEVKERRVKFGENTLPEKGKKTALMIFIKQFKDFLILILFIAAAISWYIGEMTDVYVILGVIFFNSVMGFVQEFKAEKAIESIKKMVKHTTTVIRGGEKKQVEAKEIVPGDIIEIGEGESVPADARLVSVKNLQVIESSLTGESIPSDKNIEQVDQSTPVADRKSMVYKGTQVARGAGKAVVTGTAVNTEIGKIASSLKEMEKTASAFKDKTGKLAKIMAGVAVATASIVFMIGYYVREYEFNEILLVTIASLVSSIPEGLPVVISVVLAIGAKRMAKRNAIIREFTATEMLGSVTTILTDKTGTITQSILTIKKMFINKNLEVKVAGKGYQLEGAITEDNEEIALGDDSRFDKMALIAAYCNNSQIQIEEEENKKEEIKAGENEKTVSEEPQVIEGKDVKVTGDPTEAALLILGKKAKVKETEPFNKLKKIDDLPFNSDVKFRASLIEYEDGKKEIFVVGAPEKILGLTNKIIASEEPEDLNEDYKNKIREIIDSYTENAMRVISLAYKDVSKETESIDQDDVQNLVWTGITGIIDPPREGVKEAIKAAKDAGIRVVMVTGDHKKTARSIARNVGIIDENGISMTSSELNEDEENYGKNVESINVFARVSPDDKLKIARHLRDKGELISMTGDGVNDAPALKRADVGIAMGQRGTDVAKDSAEVVLSDDNFSTIIKAIEEGRIVFKNVRHTSFFLLTTNFASAMTLITCIAIGFPIPLLATQILFVNLVTDGIMDVALATEPGHGEVMKQKPYGRDEPILNKGIVPYLVMMTILMVGLTILVFQYYLPQGETMARTGAFVTIATTQLFNAFNLRTPDTSVFKIGIFSNKWIVLAFVASLVVQLLAVKVDFVQDAFKLEDMPWMHFGVIIILSSLVLWVGELYKYIKSRTNN